ncbi:hypothetical protein ACOMHN_057059 [Nucella lapillus]
MALYSQFTKPRTYFAIVFVMCGLSLWLWLNCPWAQKWEFTKTDVLKLISSGKLKQNSSDSKCVPPVLDSFDPMVMQLYHKFPPIRCSSTMKDWVYTSHGFFHISQDAKRLYGNITCQYTPLQRSGDFAVTYGPVVEPMLDGTPLKSDFFKIKCTSSSGKTYSNVHSSVARNATVMKRVNDYHTRANKNRKDMQSDTGPLSQSLARSLNLSVFMFGFDGVSRMAWMRLLPKTRKYFLETLGGIELENYNIGGDGTVAVLLPILTGKTEEELPDSMTKHEHAKPVDNYPWIWDNFSAHGYVTAYAEDYNSFQWRNMGFDKQPTDHYMRTFQLKARPLLDENLPFCLGSLKRHVIFMNWFRDLFDTYKDVPKFFFGFHAELSHDTNDGLPAADEDLKVLLQDLESNGYLNSTLLILMSDHGARYNAFRSTDIGKLEERLPYFSFRFPPWVHKHHPDIIKTMRINVKRLTSPFDIHATFLDILNHPLTSSGYADNRSISLFHEVSKERTCADADIAPHWCACLEWEHVNKSDPLVVLAVDTAVEAINNYTFFKRIQCAELRLFAITKSLHYVPKSKVNGKMLEFINNPLPATAELYQVSFKTLPGEGHFEVTCAVDSEEKTVLLDAKEISRINMYRSQPACVQKEFPHLRPFCYCH